MTVFFVIMGKYLCLCGLMTRLSVSRDIKEGGRDPILQGKELFKKNKVTLALN
jgi:hypothetical protein